MKRFIVLLCLLFGAALVFAAGPGGQSEPPEQAGHIVLFQHMLKAQLQKCFGGEESEVLPLSADGEPQHQARNQTCDPDCDPCEPDRDRTRDRGESCIPDPICELDGDQDQQQDQTQDQKKEQKQDQSCK
jgi:hypothetical protein